MDDEGSPGDPRGSANALRDIAMMDKRHPKLVRPLRTSNTKHPGVGCGLWVTAMCHRRFFLGESATLVSDVDGEEAAPVWRRRTWETSVPSEFVVSFKRI